MKLTEEQKYVIKSLLKFDKPVQTLGGYAGTGKCQPFDSIVFTPNGQTTMGQIKKGDVICNPHGSLTTVNDVYYAGIKNIVSLNFTGGGKVKCCLDHLWTVWDRKNRKYKTIDTRTIIDSIYYRNNRSRYCVDASVVSFKSKEISIDPYLLGVLLGDGCFGNTIKLTSADGEIINRIKEIVCKDYDLIVKHDCRYDYKLMPNKWIPYKRNDLIQDIKKYNLHLVKCENKFIPEDYLVNSLDVRVSILRGLLDTDGTVDHRNGNISFCSKSKRLIEQVAWIVDSIGGISSIKCIDKNWTYKGITKKGQYYICSIQVDSKLVLFNLARKQKLVKRKRKIRKSILKYQQENSEECKCIKVSNDDGLYVTNNFIATHNTTIIRNLREMLPEFAVCAYTGKASQILRKKGLHDSSTIHSLIYIPELDEKGEMVKDKNGAPIFILNPNFSPKGIIIDEASMVGQEIYEDLKTFKVPLIFVGDHGQLEPINSNFNIMKNPDFRLETIHRNAGEIAHFAEFIRKGYRPAGFEFHSKGKVKFISKKQASDYYLKVDQIICAFNKTRVQINKEVREMRGINDNWPRLNDKVMCLRNNKTNGLFNGMQGYVKTLYTTPKNKMIFHSDGKNYDIFFDPTQFNREKYDFSGNRDDPNPFDFCDAVTCHKCQGDEFERVLVIEQHCDLWDNKRWNYTAASRARSGVVWAV